MAHYLLYWRPETVKNMNASQIVSYAGSDQLLDKKVRSGDVMWAVTSNGAGDLRLVARIAVAVVTNDATEAAALAKGGDLWEDASEFAFGSDEGSRTKQDIDLSDIARELEFDGAVARLPEAFSGKNLQAIRRLTSESEELLEAAWETEGTAPAGHQHAPDSIRGHHHHSAVQSVAPADDPIQGSPLQHRAGIHGSTPVVASTTRSPVPPIEKLFYELSPTALVASKELFV